MYRCVGVPESFFANCKARTIIRDEQFTTQAAQKNKADVLELSTGIAAHVFYSSGKIPSLHLSGKPHDYPAGNWEIRRLWNFMEKFLKLMCNLKIMRYIYFEYYLTYIF